jgi:hypothetical protein
VTDNYTLLGGCCLLLSRKHVAGVTTSDDANDKSFLKYLLHIKQLCYIDILEQSTEENMFNNKRLGTSCS